MHAKRLYAADPRLALFRFARIARAGLRRVCCGGLVFLGFFFLAVTSAQAQNVVQWTPVRIMWSWSDFNTGATKIFDSVQAAFSDAQSVLGVCNNQTPQSCATIFNLRPVPNPGAGGTILYNGIPTFWVSDRQYCTSQSCSPVGAGPTFGARLVCPNNSTPSYSATKINSDFFDGQYVCQAFIPVAQPCKDCGRGNPILPGSGQKIQIETDYASSSGGLRFERTYRSNVGYWASPATAALLDNRVGNTPVPGCFPGTSVTTGGAYSYCYPYLTTNAQGYQVKFADGRFALFSGQPGAITSAADINDKLSQQTNPSGAIEWVLRRQDDSTAVYNTQGQLIRKTSLDGREDISYTYANGRLAAMADHFGRQLVFGYDAAGRLTTMTDPGGGLYQYSYDTFENLASVTYPDGTVRQYHYNDNGVGDPSCGNQIFKNQLTGISENGQRFATFKYCGLTAISTEHAGGVDRYSFTYAGLSPVFNATEIDPLGTTRTYTHTQRLSYVVPTGTSQPAASGTGTVSDSVIYDANGNVSWRTDFNGNRTNFTYDLTRNLETQRKEGLTAAGANTPQTRTITTQWHATFRRPTGIAEPLRVTTNVYDADGTQCGALGALCSRTIQATTDVNGSLGFSATLSGTPRTWTYTHNGNGNVLTVDGPRTDVSDTTTYTYYADDDADLGKRGNVATITNALGHRVDLTAYNAHGQPLTIVDANGLTTTLTYDVRRRLTSRSVGNEVTSYDYDAVGQLIKVTLPDGSFLSYGYDPAHRLTSIIDSDGNRIAYTLDAMGNRTLEQVFDPANTLVQTRSRVFSNLNRLFRELGSLNQTTEYGYDNQGNVTSVKDPLNRVTSNQYDALNRLKQVTDPGLGVTQYGYNGLDALIQVSDPRNLVTGYTVNGLGNLTLQTSPDTGNTSGTYDAAGNVLTRTDAKGQATNYAYDALNRVALITFHDGSKQAYAYDSGTNGIGRLSSITETNSANQQTNLIQYAYSPHGRVTSETRTVGGVQYVVAYSYDSAGRLSGMTYPSGRTLAYGYDGLGRVNAINTIFNNQTMPVVADVTYHPFGGVKSYVLGNGQAYSRSYDQDGRINSYTLGAKTFLIGYDAASRIGFISESGNPVNINTYGYDSLDRLTSAVTLGTSYGYGYDAVGNRLSNARGAATDTLAYSSTSNRIATLTPGSGPIRSFVFDANGSTTNDGVNTYAYDVRRRMAQATSSIGATGYQVNALGQRVRKTNSQGDTVFHYDLAGHLLAETDPAGVRKREVMYLGDIPVAVVQ